MIFFAFTIRFVSCGVEDTFGATRKSQWYLLYSFVITLSVKLSPSWYCLTVTSSNIDLWPRQYSGMSNISSCFETLYDQTHNPGVIIKFSIWAKFCVQRETAQRGPIISFTKHELITVNYPQIMPSYYQLHLDIYHALTNITNLKADRIQKRSRQSPLLILNTALPGILP